MSSEIDTKAIANNLRDAIKDCTEALGHNSYKWTGRTDQSINQAISKITLAMSLLI